MTRIATFLRPVPVTATAIAAATGAWLAWSPVAGADTTEPGTVADLVERTSPAVVTILSTQEAPDEMAGMPEGSPFGSGSPFEEFLRRFGMPEAMPSPRRSPAPAASASARASSSRTTATSSPTTTSSTTPRR